MRIYIVNFLILVVYITLDILLEALGFTSPALFSFYGFVMGALSICVNYSIIKGDK